MQVMKPMSLGLLTRPFEMARRFRLGAAVLSLIPLGTERALFSEAGMWKLFAEEVPPGQPLDAGMAKRRAEFLVSGAAFAPGGTPVGALRVTARLAERTKSLLVAGDRFREEGGTPAPFSRMPIDWTRAAGGPGLAENPLGRGRAAVETPLGPRTPLANVEDPALPPEHRQARPAGFGPLDIGWPQRARFAGTYDDRWLREDFPGFARDLDWRYFNMAPEDQHFPGFLAGTEDYAFENMHPEAPLLAGRLPGLQPRLFLRRRGSAALEEVALVLTTVWFFPHRMRAIQVHHGEVPIEEEDGRDVECVVVGAEIDGARRPLAQFEQVLRERQEKSPKAALAALRDSDLVPAELLVPDPAMEAEKALHATEGLAMRNSRRFAEKEILERRAMVASHGLDPDEHGPTLPPPEEPQPGLDELPAIIDRLMKEAEEQRARQEAEQAERDRQLAADLEGTGMTFAEVRQERADRPKGPPAFTAEGKRLELQLLAAQLRQAGADPAEIEEILADAATRKLWQDAEEKGREAYRQTAQDQDPAPPAIPLRQDEIRAALAQRQVWRRANLCGADLRGADLSGRDLTEAWLDGADLTGANLAGTRLTHAVLAHARLHQARLDGAELGGANLGRAVLHGASLQRAVLKDAILDHADLRGASLRGAVLEGARMLETALEGADIAGAVLNGVIIMKAKLDGLSAAGARIARAVFLEASLDGADFAGATLRETTFLKCSLRGMRCGGADMHKVRLLETVAADRCVFAGADLSEANLRGVPAQAADFTDAILDDADLSEAMLAGARLFHARARRARFVAADLRDAVLARGDFMQAMLARADLRGADLTEASFYEADLARVRTDHGTRHQGMFQARMRLRPRRTQP